jgi:hypothetical protein
MPEIVLSVNQSKKDQIYLLTKRQIQSAISNSCFSATDVFVKNKQFFRVREAIMTGLILP